MSTEDPKMIGRNLAKIRMAKKLTQEDLAGMIGSSAAHVSQMETGRKGIGGKVLPKLCNALGITPNELYSGSLEARKQSDSLSPDVARLAKMLEMLPEAKRQEIISSGIDKAMEILRDMLRSEEQKE